MTDTTKPALSDEERADLKAKSLGEKLAVASANDAGLSATWADCREDVKAEFERIALAFAASLTHDETASAVIAALTARAEKAEQQADKFRDQVRDTCTRAERAESDRDRYKDALRDLALDKPVSDCATFRPDLTGEPFRRLIRDFANATLSPSNSEADNG